MSTSSFSGLIFFGLFFITQNVFAQFSISGKVIDANDETGIAHASVSLSGNKTSQMTYSDASGQFGFDKLPEGIYQLRVTYLGYKGSRQEINLEKDIPHLEIPLSEVGVFFEPLEISGVRAGENAPFTKTNISEEELEKNNLGQDLPYLLKQQPSTYVSSDAGAGVGYTSIWIRGSDATRTNLTFNGIPVNDAESSGSFFVNFPDLAASANSIQIQRGVGTSTNGAGAFGATVNLSTNTFHADPYGQVSANYGSFNTQKYNIKAGTGLLNDHFTLDARLSSITSDGFIDRASSNLKSYYLSGAYFNGKNSVRFNIISGDQTTYQAWNGVPEDSLKAGNRTYNELGLMPNGQYYPNQTDNYKQTFYQLFWNREINRNWNFNLAAFLTRGKGYYEEYKIKQSYSKYSLPDPVIGGETIEKTDLIQDRWLDNYFYGTIFSLNYNAGDFKSTLGGGWNRYDGDHYGDVIWAEQEIPKDYRYYSAPAHKKDFTVYWKNSHSFSQNLTAFLELEYRHVSYLIEGFKDRLDIIQDNRYNFFNPKAGLHYQLSKSSTFYLSYAVAHKEPNRKDFEAHVEETPVPEKLYDWELGFDQKGSFYLLHANLYFMDYKDQLVLTGKVNESGAYTRENVANSYRLGLEMNGSIHFANRFTFSADAAFSRNKIKDFTEYLDNWDNGKQNPVQHGETTISFSPSVIAGATLASSLFSNFTASLSGKYVGHRFLDNTSNMDRSLDAYFDNDLKLNYQFAFKGIKKAQLNLHVNNLFDRKYETNGFTYSYIDNGTVQTDNAYFPQAGINFLVGLQIDF